MRLYDEWKNFEVFKPRKKSGVAKIVAEGIARIEPVAEGAQLAVKIACQNHWDRQRKKAAKAAKQNNHLTSFFHTGKGSLFYTYFS